MTLGRLKEANPLLGKFLIAHFPADDLSAAL